MVASGVGRRLTTRSPGNGMEKPTPYACIGVGSKSLAASPPLPPVGLQQGQEFFVNQIAHSFGV